jgi:hypothetical protein
MISMYSLDQIDSIQCQESNQKGILRNTDILSWERGYSDYVFDV